MVADPKRLKHFMAERKGQKGEPMDRIFSLVRDGVHLGYRLAGQNGTDFENKTLRMVSPRFLSIMPDDDPERMNSVSRMQ